MHRALRRERWDHRAFIVTTHDKPRGIPRSIQRIPPMGHVELYRFYASLGLLVMPSRFETFGNVAAEALYCGTPVLVSPETGFAEVLRAAGLEDMIVDFSDPAAAVAAAKRLCGTAVPTEKLAAVKRMLDPDINRDMMLAVLREAAEADAIE
jgi:glycosyltransferase involved in cell wall biosynthesis